MLIMPYCNCKSLMPQLPSLIISVTVLLLNGCATKPVPPPEDIPTETNLTALENKAEQAYLNDQWQQAETHYAKLLKHSPKHAQYWFRIGNVYANTARNRLAISAYHKAISLNPEQVKVWHNLGISQLKEAITAFLTLQHYLNSEDPLYQSTKQRVEQIKRLLAP